MNAKEAREKWARKTRGWEECKEALAEAERVRKEAIAEVERVEAEMRAEAFRKRNKALYGEAKENDETG